MDRRIISVVGAGTFASREELAWAEEVGRLLAARGAVVVTGGLGGVMEAASKGAKEAGGLVVGILPGEDRREANRWVDVAVPTDLGHARNALVVRTGEAVIAIGGEYGTLSEIGLALKMGRRVIGLGTWEVERSGMTGPHIVRADTPEAAVGEALAGAL